MAAAGAIVSARVPLAAVLLFVRERRNTSVKLIFAAGLFAVASAVGFAQAPAGSTSQTPSAASPQRPSSQSASQSSQPQQGEQTLTGCLTSAENIYTLTVMDDTGTPGSTATTTAYTLLPGTGVDLKGFVNKRITVKGMEAGPEMQNSARVVERAPAAPAATGTSGSTASGSGAAAGNNSSNAGGGDRPTVQSESKARINAKTLNVSDVQPASGSCGAQ
jgi:hypothetical protein